MENIEKFKCEICNRSFSRKYNLRTHIKTKHEHISLDFSCYLCRKNFKDQDKYLKHIDNHKEGISFVLYKHAFQKSLQIFRKHLKIIFLSPTYLMKMKIFKNFLRVNYYTILNINVLF